MPGAAATWFPFPAFSSALHHLIFSLGLAWAQPVHMRALSSWGRAGSRPTPIWPLPFSQVWSLHCSLCDLYPYGMEKDSFIAVDKTGKQRSKCCGLQKWLVCLPLLFYSVTLFCKVWTMTSDSGAFHFEWMDLPIVWWAKAKTNKGMTPKMQIETADKSGAQNIP